MYLSLLREEKKKTFLIIAYHLASIDGNYSESEQEMMRAYCREMQIEVDLGTIEKQKIPSLEQFCQDCDEREKKIFVFELIGLAVTDGKYDESEEKFIQSLCDIFGISMEFIKECEKVLDEYMAFQNKINHLVLG